MLTETAISIKNLSKEYYRSEKSNRFSHKSVKESSFLAVNNISIDIKKGEVICISGHNGSGKSTLLKMIAEVTLPTSGEIEIDGKVASILEIGIGFQPEISGYENIFLSGAMYGLKKSEIERKIDKIIEMFGFPEFINTPVKYYSSGMYMRLAFSIIVNIEANIYLFDEVTSVGDMEFRTKVIQEISRLKNKNATILVVTHTPSLFAKITDRFMLFNKGTAKISETYDITQIQNSEKNQLLINEDTLKKIKEVHNENIDFDVISIDIKSGATELSHFFDQEVTVEAKIKYKTHEDMLMMFTITDLIGNVITSAKAELKAGEIDGLTIKYEIPHGYLKPSPLSTNIEILDSNLNQLVSYHNINNMPYRKEDLMSGYINIPIKVSAE